MLHYAGMQIAQNPDILAFEPRGYFNITLSCTELQFKKVTVSNIANVSHNMLLAFCKC